MMMIDKQVELKKKCNADAKYRKNWRELENLFTPADFTLGNKGCEQEKEPRWDDD